MSWRRTPDQGRRIAVLFFRAIRLRCPNCGGHPVLLTWFTLCANCPVCGIRLQRGEDGYWVGGYMFNLIAAELIWAGSLVALLWWTWPTPPWTVLLIGGVMLMVLSPVALFPFSRLVFLAFDLVFRPPKPDDYPGPHEPGAILRRDHRDT
jgi:uncharacterized protein (DUF983 family)